MNNILIHLYVPASGVSSDVFVPGDVPLAEALPLLGRAVSRLSGGLFVSDDTTALCDRATGVFLDIGMTAEELGLRTGTEVMMI